MSGVRVPQRPPITKESLKICRSGEISACRQAGVYMYMYYVYILRSLDKNVFYKGFTDNLERRLKQHNSGYCQTTRNLVPLELVYVQICETRGEARNLERYLKSGSGREIIQELI